MSHNVGAILKEIDAQGFCVVPDVLQGAEFDRAEQALEGAISEGSRRGMIAFDPRLDPNEHNIRLNNLPDMGPMFTGLLAHPLALAVTRGVIGDTAMVSNFTGNISYPGAGSMMVHSDQALIGPSPWIDPWAINIIWCLDDVRADNGATLYLPGSHRFRLPEDVPPDPIPMMKPFEAPRGSFIAMDGRLWHTSGVNVTRDERRALLFAFYTRQFLRGQVNWEALLPDDYKAGLDDEARGLLGIGPLHNVYGAHYVMRSGYEVETVDVFSEQEQ